jgi:hypothetical protein
MARLLCPTSARHERLATRRSELRSAAQDGDSRPVTAQLVTIAGIRNKSGANTAAIESINKDADLDIELRQSKCLNNMVEQDHRGIKRITNPMLGFKSFCSTRIIIADIEVMHMIWKGQLCCPDGEDMSAANQFYGLAY